MRRLFSRAATPPEDPNPPLLIVGLGNPGAAYARNRHNVGFWVVNRLARRAGADFVRRGRLAALAETTLADRRVLLVKPQTMMNGSGDAVRDLLRRYHVGPAALIVICDDLDRPVGALRIRERGSDGGQRGLRSIIGALGTQEFTRVRIGIGHPTIGGERTRDPEDVAAYVLADPRPDERKTLELTADRAADAVEAILAEGLNGAMARFNSG